MLKPFTIRSRLTANIEQQYHPVPIEKAGSRKIGFFIEVVSPPDILLESAGVILKNPPQGVVHY
jgi:hypothetical protein